MFANVLGKQNPDDYPLMALQDKEAFNIKYQPLCAKCRNLAGLSNSANHYDMKEKSIASLSFSSCHLGYCCRVFVESACRLCLILRYCWGFSVNVFFNLLKQEKTL